MKYQKVLPIFFVFLLVASLSFVVADDEEPSYTDYRTCVKAASIEKKEAYSLARDEYKICKEEARALDRDDRREAISVCRDNYKTAREEARETYRVSRETCRELREANQEENQEQEQEQIENKGEETPNYGQCVKDAAHEKNSCYKTAQEKYKDCRSNARSLEDRQERKDALKVCRDGNEQDVLGYNAERTACISAFKEAKESCEQPEEPQETVTAECGNSILEEDEECDDGNLEEGDGCSATCTTEEIQQ